MGSSRDLEGGNEAAFVFSFVVSKLALIAEPGADIDRFLLLGETLGIQVSHYQTGNDNPQTGKGKEE